MVYAQSYSWFVLDAAPGHYKLPFEYHKAVLLKPVLNFQKMFC
jgi:hypothetical protein